jgi:hypothetical protein
LSDLLLEAGLIVVLGFARLSLRELDLRITKDDVLSWESFIATIIIDEQRPND